ncbi:uncharacterized protein LOC127240484 [Andrographis paniculata]|uniref:uncharacterized protein LOC127240484 n=1 Tax=Andrographis paniculata TaxID=175694 RepID=UPI0021E7F92B|nr:uncharacterized protein LOC127240484 [Andrographis paniculata]
MFGNLFGWRKASKCKKLVRRVKWRLKLLTNRKWCIVNQLRKDVAELLKYGLHQAALQRVEQLIKDETTIEVYHLLDQFCERIIISIPYIRKHKDCPKEINEAASALIFSSSRLGELPELIAIRDLFKDRYGSTFVMLPLQLLPGNIVDPQMIEKVCSKNVVEDDDLKYRVLDEIATTSCVVPYGQYLLEYRPDNELQQNPKHNEEEEEGRRSIMGLPWKNISSRSADQDDQNLIRKTTTKGISCRTKRKRKRSRRNYWMSREDGIATDDVESAAAYYNSTSDRKCRPHSHSRRSTRRKKKMNIPLSVDSCQKYYNDRGGEIPTVEDKIPVGINGDMRRSWRSISFPLEQPPRTRGNYDYSCFRSCRHVHPKLPDYDELAAMFVGLKKNRRNPTACTTTSSSSSSVN